jgi:hypothetical protein
VARRTTINWISLTGVVAVFFYFAHVVLGRMGYDGYNWMAQAISDLTALDSPSYIVASRFSALYGALAGLGSLGAYLSVEKSSPALARRGFAVLCAMYWTSFVGYTMFPLSGEGYQGTVQDIFHFYVVTVLVVLLSISGLTLVFLGGRKFGGFRTVSRLAIATLALTLVGAIGTGLAPARLFGVFERVSAFPMVIFAGILGVFGFLHGDRT